MRTVTLSPSPRWRPLCHLAVGAPALRARLVEQLHGQGWAVVEHPSALHLVEALSGMILGDRPWQRAGLIVVDERAPGCRGSTIVRGLRDLGLRVPILVIAASPDPEVAALEETGGAVHVVEPGLAAMAVGVLARHHRDRGSPLPPAPAAGPDTQA